MNLAEPNQIVLQIIKKLSSKKLNPMMPILKRIFVKNNNKKTA